MTDATSAPPKPASPRREIWQQFRTHKGALFGLIVLSLLILFVVLGPLVWDPPQRLSDTIKMKNQGPSLRAPFGTDQLGRDLLLRMMQAGKVSLAVGLVAMGIAIVFGTFIGILAGYFRRLDGPLMRVTDMFLALQQTDPLKVIERALKPIPLAEQTDLYALLVQELQRLHEGVLARYGLRPSELAAWKSAQYLLPL